MMERKLSFFGKSYFYLLSGIALLCLAAAATWFAVAARSKPSEPEYLLKENAGHLALYAADGSGPLAQYDIYTRLLPEQDVLTLQQGLAVQDETELRQKLEDYGL